MMRLLAVHFGASIYFTTMADLLAQELRRDENTKGASILVLTARENVGDNLLRFGADAFLTKPINPQELISEVKRLAR